jgi:hypothetical protein
MKDVLLLPTAGNVHIKPKLYSPQNTFIYIYKILVVVVHLAWPSSTRAMQGVAYAYEWEVVYGCMEEKV